MKNKASHTLYAIVCLVSFALPSVSRACKGWGCINPSNLGKPESQQCNELSCLNPFNVGRPASQQCNGLDCVNPVKIAKDVVTTFTTAAGDVVTNVHKASGDLETTVKKANGDIETTAKKANGDFERSLRKANGDTETTIKRAGSDMVTTIKKSGGDILTTVAKAGDNTVSILQKASGDTIKTITKAGGDVETTIHKSFGDTYTTVKKTGGDTVITIQTAGSDTITTIEKGWRDTSAEARRAFENIIEAKTALARYAESDLKGNVRTYTNAAKRIREGKVVDALWGLGTEPLQNTNDSAAAAARESVILNTVGQVAASAYGGPAGAAAYAAWYTYNQTGDASLALRVGMITGATSAAFGAVGKMPSGTSGELMKKTIVGGAVGGLSVAAAGGDKDAIKDGFLRSGGVILIQAEYQNYTRHPLDYEAFRASTHDGYCMTTMHADCSPPSEAYIRDPNGRVLGENNEPLDDYGRKIDSSGKIIIVNGSPVMGVPQVDVTKTDISYNHVGNWSSENDHSITGERGVFMTTVSKIPGMNAMALFHDKWTVDADMGLVPKVSTIIPATVLTYVGSGAPVYTKIQTTFVDSSRNGEGKPTSVPTPVRSGTANSMATLRPEWSGAELTARTIPQTTVGSVIASTNAYVCRANALTRTITVAKEDGKGCRVVYRTETGLTTPWRTHIDQNYCVPKAKGLSLKLRDMGWTCQHS